MYEPDREINDIPFVSLHALRHLKTLRTSANLLVCNQKKIKGDITSLREIWDMICQSPREQVPEHVAVTISHTLQLVESLPQSLEGIHLEFFPYPGRTDFLVMSSLIQESSTKLPNLKTLYATGLDLGCDLGCDLKDGKLLQDMMRANSMKWEQIWDYNCTR